MEATSIAEKDFNSMATTFKGLSDPSRLHLLAILLGGETNVNDLAAQSGLSPSATSHQLRAAKSRFQLPEARGNGLIPSMMNTFKT